MITAGGVRPAGTVGLRLIRSWPSGERFGRVVAQALPWFGLPAEVNRWRMRNLPNLWRGLWRITLARTLGLPCVYGALYLRVQRADGTVLEYGLASLRVVTDAGVNFMRDNLRGSIATIANMKFHGFGTGTTAEATGDVALVTELTTQYAVDNTRPTGTQAANGTGDYRTIATLAPDAGGTIAVTEHGIFDQAAVAGGTLLDRSKFAAVNLVAGSDSLQTTYDYTTSSGG